MTTSDTLQIVFAGVVAISTVIYSILTWKLVTETRRIREFQITPDVNIFFEWAEADAGFIYIVLKNSGLGCARNVSFEIIKDFRFYDDKMFHLKSKGLIENGISSFYANQSFRFFFTDISQNSEKKIADSLEIKITFYDLNNKRYCKQIKLTLAEIIGMGNINPPDNYIGRISYELSELRKMIKPIIDRAKSRRTAKQKIDTTFPQ